LHRGQRRSKEFDTSGKSPAYVQHRKIWPAPEKPVAGLLNRAAAEFRGAFCAVGSATALLEVAEKIACAVGQITGISSASQELARAGKPVAGFFN
jgi:hypothetical protein